MSQPLNLDKHGAELTVGSSVIYADGDELHAGKVVYIAPAETAEIVIEGRQGLVIRYGEESGHHISYDHVIARGGIMSP